MSSSLVTERSAPSPWDTEAQRAAYIQTCTYLSWSKWHALINDSWSSMWDLVFIGDRHLARDVSRARSAFSRKRVEKWGQ